MPSTQYCNRWNRVKRKKAGAISEGEARRRFAAREPFCVVVLDDVGRPQGFVEIGGNCFDVGFLDDQGRLYLDYIFEDVGGRLFLSQAISWQRSVGDGQKDEKTHIIFNQDGTATADRIVGNSATTQQLEPADVTKNWQRLPQFDEVPSLLKDDR